MSRFKAYFVVNEVLANVARHAPDSHARVDVLIHEGWMRVTIADDGPGGASMAGGTGLRGLSDRVGLLDGVLELENPPGAGTTVRVRMPLHPGRATGAAS